MAANQDNENGLQDEASQPQAQSTWKQIWSSNRGMFFVLLANFAGSILDATARFLQQSQNTNGSAMHPFQIIAVRMGVTGILSTAVLASKGTPDFLLGARGVRGWLILRAGFGFFGLACLYYSVHYLPLAEATVMRFLVPIVTAWACYAFLGQEFTIQQLTAGIIALVGVIIIAHPAAIFGERTDPSMHLTRSPHDIDQVSPAQRLIAIVVSLLGVIGASGAYTTIRVIGSRAHPLISVNYFSFISTLASVVALAALPGIDWVMPRGARDWGLLALLGLLGFILQYLLTTGLTVDKSPRATSMLYTQVIFALFFDYVIWGGLPGGWSIFGGLIVIVSTLWSALQKKTGSSRVERRDGSNAAADEESALLGAQTAAQGSEDAARKAGGQV